MNYLVSGASDIPWFLLVGLGSLVLGVLATIFIPIFRTKQNWKKGQKVIRDAEDKADHLIKKGQLDAKQAAYEIKIEAEKELRERKQEIQEAENKLLQREQGIDRRDAALIQKETALEEKSEALGRAQKEAEKKQELLQQKLDSIISELEKVAHMSVGDAKDELFKRVEQKISKEIAAFIKNKEEEARETAQATANEIISLAISKYAQEATCEKTVAVVA
ncbi:MAG: DUF3552 domain-containing protein, partial [Bacilli bacterium]|nr:DUF3552 domain-containing protein [Bacilli bacterium]